MKSRHIRRRHISCIASALMLGLLTFLPLPTLAKSPQIWFAPLDELPRDFLGKRGGSTDFMRMFQRSSPWGEVAAHVTVFKIYTAFALSVPTHDLAEVIQGLKERQIHLAIETQFLEPGPNCGKGVEGYGEEERLVTALTRIRDSGGEVDFIAMDEPLFYGHVSSNRMACHLSIMEVAEQVAERFARAKSIFPKVELGDIEPLTLFDVQSLPQDLKTWVRSFRKTTDERLGFVHADTEWKLPWIKAFAAAVPALKAENIPFGVIYNTSGRTNDDSDEARLMLQHEIAVEVDNVIPVDHVIFQSWTTTPHHALPETDPHSFTGIIASYLRERTRVTGLKKGFHVVGKLASFDGASITKVPVQLQYLDSDGPGRFHTFVSEGVAPSDAQSAMLAIRINTECHCSSRSDVGFRFFEFSQDNVPALRQGATFYKKAAWQVAGSAQVGFVATDSSYPDTITVKAQPDQSSQINQKGHFTVVGGARFKFSVQLRCSLASDDSGSVAIIFLGKNGHEVDRESVPIRAAYQEDMETVTDAEGKFDFLAGPAVSSKHIKARLYFGGDNKWFPSQSSL